MPWSYFQCHGAIFSAMELFSVSWRYFQCHGAISGVWPPSNRVIFMQKIAANIISVTYSISIPNVDISSLVNEVAHCFKIPILSCHMQGSRLMERMKQSSSTDPQPYSWLLGILVCKFRPIECMSTHLPSQIHHPLLQWCQWYQHLEGKHVTCSN